MTGSKVIISFHQTDHASSRAPRARNAAARPRDFVSSTHRSSPTMRCLIVLLSCCCAVAGAFSSAVAPRPAVQSLPAAASRLASAPLMMAKKKKKATRKKSKPAVGGGMAAAGMVWAASEATPFSVAPVAGLQ